MVSRRELHDYAGRYLTVKDAVYLVCEINRTEGVGRSNESKRKMPHQEEVVYDTKKLDWVAKVGKQYKTMDEIRKLGYNISHMVFPVPLNKFANPSDRTKYSKIIEGKSVFFNLKTGRWSYIIGERKLDRNSKERKKGDSKDQKEKQEHGPLVEENIQNKLYECLYEVIKNEVSQSLHRENREKIARFIVRSMGRLHNRIEDLEEILSQDSGGGI